MRWVSIESAPSTEKIPLCRKDVPLRPKMQCYVSSRGVLIARQHDLCRTGGVWATSQIAQRDCGSHRQGNLSGIHLAMQTSQQYDAATIAILRRALDEVFMDPRFLDRRSTSALETAEHLLSQAATGERDFDRLKASAFNKLMGQ